MLYCMQTAQQALKPSRMALEDMSQPLQAAFFVSWTRVANSAKWHVTTLLPL